MICFSFKKNKHKQIILWFPNLYVPYFEIEIKNNRNVVWYLAARKKETKEIVDFYMSVYDYAKKHNIPLKS